MRKYSILLLLIIALSGCKKSSNEVTINGEIEGLGTDTIYLYGMDELYDRIDTIYVNNDKFSYQTEIDTITPAYLLLKDQTEYPIFLDKSNKIKIKGNITQPELLNIDGNIHNEEFYNFQKALTTSASTSEKEIQNKAEEFIKQHHSSLVSLYLLDKYFVQMQSPDYAKIKELISIMTGVLQDKPYIANLNEVISQIEKSNLGKYAPFFSLPNIKGEKITRSSEIFKGKCLLINFWASWSNDTFQKQNNKVLRALYAKYKKSNHLGMLGISLDLDKKEWEKAIKNDTLNWEQVCNFGGLNAEIAKQFSVTKIPLNILLSAEGKIIARDIAGESLKKEVDKAINEAIEKNRNKQNK